MSISKDQYKALTESVKDLTALLKEVSDTLDVMKEEVTDTVGDSLKGIEDRLQKIEAYLKDTIEPNQQTIYKAIEGEEDEPTDQPSET